MVSMGPSFFRPTSLYSGGRPGPAKTSSAVRTCGRGAGWPVKAASDSHSCHPCRPIAIAKLSVVVDGEELALSAIAPRRDGRAPYERAAKRDPVSYLMRPCFFSHSLATSFGSFLSTSTSLFMAVSSAVVSLGAMEFTIFLKSSPALVR